MSAEEPSKRNVNDKEIQLIQATFDEPFLKALRALFLGLDVTEAEKRTIKTTFTNPELRAIMWRRFYPQLDRSTPIGQVQDVWMGVEKMVYGFSPDTIYQAVRYKEIALAYTKQALELLDNPHGEQLALTFAPPIGPQADADVRLQVNLLARNQFITHVETQLLFFWMFVQQKVESPEVKAVKKSKDSAK